MAFHQSTWHFIISPMRLPPSAAAAAAKAFASLQGVAPARRIGGSSLEILPVLYRRARIAGEVLEPSAAR
jgi:hypothetical protein